MTTHIHTPSAVDLPRISRHVGWFAFGNLVAFLIPYVGVSVLDLQHGALVQRRPGARRRARGAGARHRRDSTIAAWTS